MALTKRTIGSFIEQISIKNKDGKYSEVLGVAIEKEFMPSVANLIGTDLKKYFIVSENEFAFNPMHVGRDKRLPIALYKSSIPTLVSPAYFCFKVTDSKIDNEYLMLLFKYKKDLIKQGDNIPLVLDIRNIKFNENFQGTNIGFLYKTYNYVQRLYSCENNLFIPINKNINIEINDNKLIFKINNNIIGYLQYWYDNYTSYTYLNTIPCSGIIVYFSENYIKELNSNKNLYIACNYKKFVSKNMQPFTNPINEYKKLEIYKF